MTDQPVSGDQPGKTASQDIRAALRDVLTNAIRYWEVRRIIYNVVLTAIVLLNYFFYEPAPRGSFAELLIPMFFLAVIANVFYCTAYPVDVFVQMSGFRSLWLRWRWVLFIIGLTYASILAYVITGGAAH